MPFSDLREFLEALEKKGELTRISGAHWNLEIGVLSELAFERQGPALFFENIADYPSDYRIVSNLCTTRNRALMALGIDAMDQPSEIMIRWKERLSKYRPVPPARVARGPVLENEYRDQQIDLFKFPIPHWHELDGGRYIGTGDCVILRDPDDGRINVGTYRLQVQDRCTTTIQQSPRNDGAKILQKYWKKGVSAPMAATLGQEPVCFLTACGRVAYPAAASELDLAGFLRGEPVEVIEGKLTGLPIPATAEVAFEGVVPPPNVESRGEGPFGEVTGYYWGGTGKEPVIQVQALYHRDRPILLGAPPFKPVPSHYAFPLPMGPELTMWIRLEGEGATGVTGVRNLGYCGATVIRVRQESEAQVPQLMSAVSRLRMSQRLVILVDDDIDINNAEDVLWAVGTRCDPATNTLTDTFTSNWDLNPSLTIEQRRQLREENIGYPFTRIVFNACQPFLSKPKLSPVNKFSEKLRRETLEKWSNVLDWKSNR
jgi:UbiD family decarboxylase